MRFPWGRYGHQIDEGKRETAPEDSAPLAGDKRRMRYVRQEMGAGLQNMSTLPPLGSNEDVIPTINNSSQQANYVPPFAPFNDNNMQ